MFNMLNEGFNKKFLYESQLEPIEKEIKRVLKNAGYNVDSEDADNYIKSAAEYIDYSRTVGGDNKYSVKQWLADTEMNYPDDLSFMKESLTEADEVEDDDTTFIDDISFDDVDDEIEMKEEPINDENKPDNLGTFHNDNGNDYKVIERSESGKNALLQRGKQWVIAYNCPESNEGSWGQGHYFFDEEEARKVWEDKYLNESLNEDYNFKLDDSVKEYIKYYFPDDYQLDKIPTRLTFADVLANMQSRRGNLVHSGLDSVLVNRILYGLADIIGDDEFNKAFTNWEQQPVRKNRKIKESLDVEAMFTAMYDMFIELKNSNPELYKKGKSIYNKYATHPIKESKGNKPMRIIKEDYNQKLRESIRKIVFRLTEAEMSDEDKRDTEILRNIYKKIDGRKIGKNTFTPEEQEVIDKYGLDVWGYRGDSKVVTGSGRKDVVNSSEYKNSWGRPQQKFDKINYADRARKIDDRDYAQQINRRKGWNQTFDDAEKEMQGWKQSERINQMKRALKDRKYYQNEIDNAEDNLTNRLNRAEADADKKIADANKRMRDETSWARTSRDAAQKSINDILDKHRVKECMNQLKEATSPEDKRESDILRNIYYKMQNRSNAKLTPEEQEVVDKYNLVRTYNRNLKSNDTDDYLFRRGENKNASWYDSDSFVNSKINYADRARKLGTRDYAQDINSMNSWDSGKTFKDKERTKINNELGKDVSDMKDALYDRKYNNERIVNAEKDYQNKVAKIEAEKELAKERAKKYSAGNLERSRQKVADANTNIKKLLNKEESLKEDAGEKRIVSTGLSGVKNEEILDSVIGQMSDGIWENSPGMDGYWIPASIDGCDILVDNNQFIKHGADRYGDSKYIDNKYYRKSDDEVRRFFANKIKQITQEYLNDNNLNPYSDWRPDNDEVCDYLDRGSGVTVGDAYKAYKALK